MLQRKMSAGVQYSFFLKQTETQNGHTIWWSL